MSEHKSNRSVLYVGQCYYNHWYLSRELRKLGWKADQLNLEDNYENKNFYHGEDLTFGNPVYEDPAKKLEYYLYSLSTYRFFHFANKDGLYFIKDFDSTVNKGNHHLKKLFLKFVFKKIVKKRIGVLFRLFYFFGPKNSTKILKFFANSFPERWDILLLKYFDKKIAYTNNGCHDGVSKSSFKKWNTPTNEPVCTLCPLYYSDDLCTEADNHKWGQFRNAMVDYQTLLGSNRIDYNLSANAHENPWVYCLDKNLWSPDLLIPSNYILPIASDTIKIYHAIGNNESRTVLGNKSIKSTHIYLPVLEKLKKEGHNIQLIFFNDVPSKSVRYYQAQADIFVDMLSYGFFGANIREGLMLGKPCVCYLRPEWLADMKKELPEYVNELPVISASELDIYEVLKELILNKTKREEIGKRSRAFAEKWHASDIAAIKMAAIYESLQ